MTWEPPIEIAEDTKALKISATDLSNDTHCARFLALKVRPQVKRVGNWERLWPTSTRAPFPLDDVISLVIEAHSRGEAPFTSSFESWIQRRMQQRGMHFLVHSYVKHAVEKMLETHEVIEAEIGQLNFLYRNPSYGLPGRQIWVWAPLYETTSGVREIRRIRLGSVHEVIEENDHHWAVCAAFIAAKYRSRFAPTRIRVLEIGLLDGSSSVLFDATPGEAETRYNEVIRPKIGTLTGAIEATPCRSCGECKSAGSCPELIQLEGALGQEGRGYQSRSIAPNELDQYNKCPAQWLLASHLHLPKEETAGEGAMRGKAVHCWLAFMHSRSIACKPSDLPSPDSIIDSASIGGLTVAEYAMAYPFLLNHIEDCPFKAPESVAVLVDENIYGFDSVAQVVIAGRPDLIYRSGETLVIREVKTIGGSYEKTQHEAYDENFQIAFMINILSNGLAGHYGSILGRVELEVLTEGSSQLWEWNLDNPVTLAVAAGDVRRAVSEWHTDDTWQTRTGPHCSWCPVARWCPDRDVWQERQQLASGS